MYRKLNSRDITPLQIANDVTEALVRNWDASDVTIATAWPTAFAAMYLSEQTLPFYYMQHDEEVFFAPEQTRQRLTCRMTYHLPLHLIANSRWLQEQIKQKTGKDSLLINHALANSDIFNIAPQEFDSKFADGKRIKVISYCDRRPFKGWKYSADAMRLVQEKHPAVEWVTFGGELPAPGVKVTHLGKISNEKLAAAYKESRIGLFSSLCESFPLQPLEMMACGCATVTTPLGTEAYTRDEENCLVAQPGDAQELANKIILLLNNIPLAKKIAMNGIATSNNFTWADSTRRLLEIIEIAKCAGRN
ncbi:MAG: glycosyltransferase family 4 protein [Elusimicrobiales bacterium]|nr:glycosyltransferase family 4 protein [Elusimicrobiales bacterium]